MYSYKDVLYNLIRKFVKFFLSILYLISNDLSICGIEKYKEKEYKQYLFIRQLFFFQVPICGDYSLANDHLTNRNS